MENREQHVTIHDKATGQMLFRPMEISLARGYMGKRQDWEMRPAAAPKAEREPARQPGRCAHCGAYSGKYQLCYDCKMEGEN